LKSTPRPRRFLTDRMAFNCSQTSFCRTPQPSKIKLTHGGIFPQSEAAFARFPNKMRPPFETHTVIHSTGVSKIPHSTSRSVRSNSRNARSVLSQACFLPLIAVCVVQSENGGFQ